MSDIKILDLEYLMSEVPKTSQMRGGFSLSFDQNFSITISRDGSSGAASGAAAGSVDGDTLAAASAFTTPTFANAGAVAAGTGSRTVALTRTIVTLLR